MSTFHLEAPSFFRGLHPEIPVTMYQRHLPHWRQDGATYFVTFRLNDALPRSRLDQLRRWRRMWEKSTQNPTERDWKKFAREFGRMTEGWLDEGHGECTFRNREMSQVVTDALLHFQDDRCVTSAFVVMPNHCHVSVKPLEKYSLESLLESWKKFVARKVNRLANRKGSLWQSESYDRIIRDEEHLWRVIRYIGKNPSKAGLAEPWRCWLHPDFAELGWAFEDG